MVEAVRQLIYQVGGRPVAQACTWGLGHGRQRSATCSSGAAIVLMTFGELRMDVLKFLLGTDDEGDIARGAEEYASWRARGADGEEGDDDAQL